MSQDVKDIERAIESWIEDASVEEVENELRSWTELRYAGNTAYVIPGVDGTVRVVDAFGGSGKGEDAWIVISVTVPGWGIRHFRKTGGYGSFHGFDWDGPFQEVQAQEKVITVWI
jgi:hypothetical protein